MPQNPACPNCAAPLKAVYFREYGEKKNYSRLDNAKIVLFDQASDEIIKIDISDILYCPIGKYILQKKDILDLNVKYFEMLP